MQSDLSRRLANESLHDLQLLFAASLKSMGVVKNISRVLGEHRFILDAVLATLTQRVRTDEVKYECH